MSKYNNGGVIPTKEKIIVKDVLYWRYDEELNMLIIKYIPASGGWEQYGIELYAIRRGQREFYFNNENRERLIKVITDTDNSKIIKVQLFTLNESPPEPRETFIDLSEGNGDYSCCISVDIAKEGQTCQE